MTDRTNRHNSTNGEAWGSIENLGEYGWSGNGGIFGSWGSWVKYGGNMLRCGGRKGKVWEHVLGVWESMGRCVWGVGKGVERVLW